MLRAPHHGSQCPDARRASSRSSSDAYISPLSSTTDRARPPSLVEIDVASEGSRGEGARRQF
eukprot:9500081-Pyramimonas_sp.AAC.1